MTQAKLLVYTCLALAAVATSPAVGVAANQQAGQHLFAVRCAACHEATASTRKPGPPLAGVFGRASGSVPDFHYSPALSNAHLIWDGPTLDKWLQGPPALVHGTTMFANVPNATDRANLIAYLETLSPHAAK
jgi:cytochrome c